MPTSAIEPSGSRRFELIRTLGTGSFGSVYLAEMEGAGGFRRRVALKLLNPTWDAGSDASRRLRDEARLLGRLQHKHIVRVDDLVRLEGRWALVMEYVPGVDLESVVSPPEGSTSVGALPVRAALEAVAAVASALRAAHASPDSDGQPMSVVHRDIKPSNIRITESGDLKVLDFGVARASFAGRESKTEQVRYGSLGYMSPERLLGGDETPAGDVYALGVVLFELITRRTFGRVELAPDAQQAQVKRAAEELTVIAREEVAEWFTKMLAYEPEDRPDSREIEMVARRLMMNRDEPDLASWCLENVPLLEGLRPGGEPGLTGRVLAESDQTGRAIVNGGTLAVPESEIEAMVSATPVRAGASSGTLVAQPEPPARSGRSLQIAWIVGALTIGGGLLATVVLTMQTPKAELTPPPPAEIVAAAAVPVAPSAGVPPPPETAVQTIPSVVRAAVPVPAAAPAKAPAAGTQDAKPTSASSPAAAAVAVLPAEAPAASNGPRLRSAKFVVNGTSDRIEVVCGDVRSTGMGNALVQSFPAGRCTVTAAGATTTVDVQEPRKVDCTLQGASLSCR